MGSKLRNFLTTASRSAPLVRTVVRTCTTRFAFQVRATVRTDYGLWTREPLSDVMAAGWTGFFGKKVCFVTL